MYRHIILLLLFTVPAAAQIVPPERGRLIFNGALGMPLLFTADAQGSDEGTPTRFLRKGEPHVHAAIIAGYRFYEGLGGSILASQILMRMNGNAFDRYTDSLYPADFIMARDMRGGLLYSLGAGLFYTLSFGDLDIEPSLHLLTSGLSAPRTNIYRKQRETNYVTVITYEPGPATTWTVVPALAVKYVLEDKPGYQTGGLLLRLEYYRGLFDDRYNVDTEDILGARSSRPVEGTVRLNVATLSLGAYVVL